MLFDIILRRLLLRDLVHIMRHPVYTMLCPLACTAAVTHMATEEKTIVLRHVHKLQQYSSGMQPKRLCFFTRFLASSSTKV